MVLFNANCIDKCQVNYTISNDKLTCVLNSNIPVAPTDPNLIPLPFTIVTAVGVALILGFKLHFKQMFVPASVLGCLAIVEWASWLTLMFLTIFSNPNYGRQLQYAVMIYAILLNLLLNAVNYFCFRKIILTDHEFEKWRSNDRKN